MIRCDVRKCVGCRMCEVTCGAFHFAAVSPALARIRVSKLEEIGIDMAVACVGCEERPCLDCALDALSVGSRGEIRVDGDLCSGCEECVDRCPIGAVGFREGAPLFCDLCDGKPACVDSCPTGALDLDEDRRVSLKPFLGAAGGPGSKRARYVREEGRPLREKWTSGGRVDT